MLSSFLQVLLTALIAKSHNLLQEEIIAAIYNMVSSNFDIFFTQFIPHYLMNLDGLRDHQRSQLHQNFKRHQVILKDKFIWEDPSSRNLFPLISISLFRKYKLLKVLDSFYFWCSIKFSKKSVGITPQFRKLECWIRISRWLFLLDHSRSMRSRFEEKTGSADFKQRFKFSKGCCFI